MANGTPFAPDGLTRGVQLGAGVVVDRLVVSGPDVLTALETTRAIWERYPLRILDAPKGAGKTFALARVSEGRRLVCMTDRVALAQQMAARFGAELRLPTGSDPAAIAEQARTERLAVTIHAAGRLGQRAMTEDVLVVDEAIHCLGTLANGRELRGWARGRVDGALKRAVRESGEVWLAQAGWRGEDLRAAVDLARQAGRTERVIHVVVAIPQVRGSAMEAPTREGLRNELLTAARVGPVFYAGSSRTACEAIQQEAQRLGLDPLVVTSRTSHTERVQRWLAKPAPELEPFVIVSPSVVSGLSIDTKDGQAAYPSVFLEFLAWPGGPGLDDALQFACRVRGAPALTWWAPPWRLPARTASEHYADELVVADQTAMVLGNEPRGGTELDALAAERTATEEASLCPIPRRALADGLRHDGWRVVECKPELPSGADIALWRAARTRATDAYLSELRRPDRGPADQRTVEERLRELGREGVDDLTDADLDAVAWLEREHRQDSPIDLLIATLAPQRVWQRDLAEQGFPARADMRHDVQAGELARALLDCANVDRERLVSGASFDVRHTDLLAFVELAQRHEAPLLKLLGSEAPKGERGATRSFLTLMIRLGCKRLGSTRAGADRVRSYKLRLHPIAVEALERRGGTLLPIAPAGSAGVFPRAPEDTLAARVPMRVLPEIVAALPAIERRAAHADEQDGARLSGAVAALQEAAKGNGLITATGVRREDSGRIHLRNVPIQAIPKSVRHLIVPELSGDVFVSADFRSAHLAIAAVRTGDTLLYELVASADAYERLAERFLVGVPDGRGKMKVAVLAMINGAGAGKLGEIVGSAEVGRRIHGELRNELPGLHRCVAEAKRTHADQGGVAEVTALTGRVRRVRKASGPGGWRRLLSALWSSSEAEALDHVLANLPLGARLAAPMFDGLLVSCATVDAERVERELAAAMVAGSRAAGFEARVKVGAGATWGAAEGLGG